MENTKYPFPQGMPKPKELWIYDVEYYDTTELIKRGRFKATPVNCQLTLPELMYLYKSPAITITMVNIDIGTMYY